MVWNKSICILETVILEVDRSQILALIQNKYSFQSHSLVWPSEICVITKLIRTHFILAIFADYCINNTLHCKFRTPKKIILISQILELVFYGCL